MNRDPSLPLLSVVVPVRNGEHALGDTLDALAASDVPRSQWELIVVDDASADESALVAARHADAVVRLPGPSRGPAYARNRGAELGRGRFMLFLSADVRVRPDSLRLLMKTLQDQPEVAAVSALRSPPQSASVPARYRAERLRLADARAASDASTFSAGCGIIRRDAFFQAGMWDEWHQHRPRIEAADLSARLRALGYKLVTDHRVDVEHMREWDAGSLLAADLRDPGIQLASPVPSRDGAGRRAAWRRQASDVRTGLLLLFAIAAAIVGGATGDAGMLAVAAACLALAIITDAAFHVEQARRHGVGFALRALPLHLASSLGEGVAATIVWLRHHLIGAPRPHPAVEAFAEVGVETWPPVPRRRLPEAQRAQ